MHDKPTQDVAPEGLGTIGDEFMFGNRVLVIVRTGSVTTKPAYVDLMEVDTDFNFLPVVVKAGI